MKKKNDLHIFWIIVIVVFILIFAVLTFGLAFKKREETTQEIEEKLKLEEKEKLETRLRRINELLEKKKELKEKKDKIFRRSYLIIRIFIVILIGLYNFLGYSIFKFDSLGEYLNWSEVALIGIAIILFIAYHDTKDIKNVIENLKKYIMFKVYGKFLDIEDEIVKHELEKVDVKKQIDSL